MLNLGTPCVSKKHTAVFTISASPAIICFPAMPNPKPKRAYEAVLIGKQIRYYRRIKEISQTKLARNVGVTVGWIGRIERGIHLPNIKLLFKISRALQVKVKDLIPF